MKKNYIVLFLLTFVVLLAGCSKSPNDTVENASNDLVFNERYPSFVVENVTVAKDAKNAVVYVSLENNPGFLTMGMNITYDSEYLTLKKVLNGSEYSEYYFIGPKNMESGCTASWFIPEISSDIVDGNILELHFEFKEHTPKGKYLIQVSRPDNGGVVDQNKQEIIFNNATGYIEIV